MVATLMGCDSSARSKGGELALGPEGESIAYESCSTTADCEGELRCIDLLCIDKNRSRLGDFYAASGRRALGTGDTEMAAKAYNSAVTQYEKEKLAPPLDVLCEQGVALAAGREDQQLAEAGARILHKCVLAVPGGGRLARQAYDALASLGEAGLDENVIARSEPGDLYMSGEALQPDLNNLKLSVQPQGKKNKKRGFAALVTALEAPGSKQAFGSCWQSYWKKSKQATLRVEIPFEYHFILDEDDESGDKAVLKIGERQAPGDANLAAAGLCIEDAAAAVATAVVKGMRDDTRWKTSILIQIGE